MQINFKEIGISSFAIGSFLAYSPQTAYAQSFASIWRRNAPYAADAAVNVNQMNVFRTGKTDVTAFNYEAVNRGETFITGCETEVIFDRTGLVNLRFNVHQYGNNY